MQKLGAVFLLMLLAPAYALEDFGTFEEGDRLAAQVVQLIDERGMAGAAESLFDPDLPFASTRQGINLFEGSVLVGDNREPEMVEEDFSQLEDLTGAIPWTKIESAMETDGLLTLKWYHYDTQEPYDYNCIARRARNPRYAVLVCR